MPNKVVAGQIKVHIDGMADRRDIAWAVPAGADVEELATGGNLARHVEATHV
jgi:hypothetical protein